MVITEVRSISFGLVLHMQHIIANYFNLPACVPPPTERYYNSYVVGLFSIVECGIARFVCAYVCI